MALTFTAGGHHRHVAARVVSWWAASVMAMVLPSAASAASANEVADDSASTGASGASVDFAHEVIPILREHCVECHGGMEAKGGFSLNTRELVTGSGYVDIEDADASYLLELVASEDPDMRMPPKDREPLSADQVRTLRRWIGEGVPWEAGFTFAPTVYEPPLKPRRPELPTAVDGRTNPIDRILDDYLARQGLERPPAIDDAAFYRRVHLDLVGLLPEPEALEAFLADPSPDKRTQVVEALLSEDVAYADHWMTFFNDLLRNDYSGTGFITGGRKQITQWLYGALVQNMPFDQLTRELIAPPSEASEGYIRGIQWRGETSAAQTVEVQFAQNVAQSFLGINMKCASCHDSFIDRWTLDEAYGLAAIYAERPLEMHRCDIPVGRVAEAAWLFPELGQIDAEAPRDERLRQLAALMTHPDNGRFTRTIVNRLWYEMMGRGIVHPLDAMQSEPWNADLLDYLACYLADEGYDLKQVLRLIATSEAYQSRCAVVEEEPVVGARHMYRGPLARRMTAEQFLDAVWQITGAAPSAPDAEVQALAPHGPAADGEATDGERPMVRASLLANNALMRALGRPTRDQIVSMRPEGLSTLEAIQLANEQSLADAFAQGAERLAAMPGDSSEEIVRYLYAFALSREPTPHEMDVLCERLGSEPTPQQIADVMWAVCMLPEFMLVR